MAANDLVTVANVEAHLDVATGTGDQDQLGRQIEVASQLIEDYLDRKLISQEHIDYYDGRRSNRLILKQWPVTTFTELRLDSTSVFTAASTLVSSDDYRLVNQQEILLLSGGTFNYGSYSIKATYTAGWAQADLPATIRNACLQLVDYLEQKRTNRDLDKKSKNKGGETTVLVQGIPELIAQQLEPYKRIQFALGEVTTLNG